MATVALKPQNFLKAADKLNLKQLDSLVQQLKELRASKVCVDRWDPGAH